uniref:Uncharacterized protein n=1 Tax=Arundo donax TaxID=35708 RepID=A0A0A9AJ88_ARUDO
MPLAETSTNMRIMLQRRKYEFTKKSTSTLFNC